MPLFGTFGSLIAATIINAFVITTLDTATRITRYITEELYGVRNKYVSTLIVVFLAMYLAFGNWKKIWPVFGASNQLVAALALLVASAYLLSRGRKSIYTLIPSGIMIVTACAALIWQFAGFFRDGSIILSIIAGLLTVLAVYMVILTMIFFTQKKNHAGYEQR
jgi:carbon starvation protein